ncbi:hypothetical protein Syun_029740 [Stephania yunnanensis]|uniref:Uncharacterized protein n=1 Tax=Stephania yunnanensis TaxID=152371 RepID=A0AAP0HK50_9MAGN
MFGNLGDGVDEEGEEDDGGEEDEKANRMMVTLQDNALLCKALPFHDRRHDSRSQGSRRSIDISSLQLQFPTGTYNQANNYVSQHSIDLVEDDEADTELTFGHRLVGGRSREQQWRVGWVGYLRRGGGERSVERDIGGRKKEGRPASLLKSASVTRDRDGVEEDWRGHRSKERRLSAAASVVVRGGIRVEAEQRPRQRRRELRQR